MNKHKLLEATFNKIVGDSTFIAFYLQKVALHEKRTLNEMLVLLNCTIEDYYKLGLCKAPGSNSPDFKSRIEKIAEYTNTSSIILSNIITYSTIQQQIEHVTFIKKLQKLFTLPGWLIRSQARIYQAGISIVVIILFVISFTPNKQETKNLQSFIGNYINHTDSIKYTQAQDNTFVFKNKL